MPDPKLVELGKEIGALLKKNDVVGVVILHSENFSEYVMEVEASWTCFRWEKGPDGKTNGLRILSNATVEPDIQKRKWRLTNSMGVIVSNIDIINMMKERFTSLLMMFGKLGGQVSHHTTDEGQSR